MENLIIPPHQLTVLSEFTQKGLEMKKVAEEMVVTTPVEVLNANATFKQIQGIEKAIESQRKDMVYAFNDVVKQINTLAKEVSQPTEQAKLIIQQKLLAYDEKIEAERRAKAEEEARVAREIREREEAEARARAAEEAKIRAEEEARIAKIRAEQNAEKIKIEEQRLEIERKQRELEQNQREIDAQREALKKQEEDKIRAEKQAFIDQATKVKGVRTTMDFKIVDPGRVPANYLSPDEDKIKKAIKAGVTEIAGVEIFQKKRIQ